MRRRQLVLGLPLLVGTSAAGCLTPSEPDPDEEPPDVELLNHELVREERDTEEEVVAIVGEVRIRPNADVRYIELRAVFYDDEEDVLDSTVQNVEEIDERPEIPFRIEFPFVGERARAVIDYEVAIETVL